jgi:alkylation response protein AidB-like acyl-CoA dehydrogenase
MTTTVQHLDTSVGQLTRLVREHAEQLATGDRLPAELVAAAQAGGLYRLCLSTELGGLGTPLPDTLAAVIALSHADGSVGWCTVVANAAAALLNGVEQAQARTVAADPERLLIAGGFPPSGVGRQVGDTYQVSGHWRFASGCASANWILAGMMAESADGAPPRHLVTFFPADAATIVPNWDVIGLRATGSHDITAHDVVVPAGRTTPLFGGPRWAADPVAAIPFFGFAPLLAAVPLGCAERALDELVALAEGKIRHGQQQTLAQDPVFQVEHARVRARLNAARGYLADSAEAIWRTATQGTVTPQAITGTQLAVNETVEAALAAVHFAHRAAGTSSIGSQHILTRCLNDATVATRHAMFHNSLRQSGRTLLGLPPM